MDIAKYEFGYQSIMPVGAVTQIRYMPQRDKRQQQEQKKESSFQMIFRAQLEDKAVEEAPKFDVYC